MRRRFLNSLNNRRMFIIYYFINVSFQLGHVPGGDSAYRYIGMRIDAVRIDIILVYLAVNYVPVGIPVIKITVPIIEVGVIVVCTSVNDIGLRVIDKIVNEVPRLPADRELGYSLLPASRNLCRNLRYIRL